MSVCKEYQIGIDVAVENVKVVRTQIDELRVQRILEQRQYLSFLEIKIDQNKRTIKIAKRLIHSDLNLYLNDRKQLLKLRLKIKRELAMYDVMCQIEANTTLRVEDKEDFFQVHNNDITLTIDRRSVIIISNKNWHHLGNITKFDYSNFYQLLPKQYWVGVLRDKRIDSILNDLDD